MSVQYHVRREPRSNEPRKNRVNSPSKTLFVGNMSFEMSDTDLNNLFRNIDNVVDVRVAVDRRSGQPRGFCHADFLDVASAEKAKGLLETKEVFGRQLRVDYSHSASGAAPRERRYDDRRANRSDGGDYERKRPYERRDSPREGGRGYGDSPREGRSYEGRDGPREERNYERRDSSRSGPRDY
jgi:RNA recognition motif-containing protein